MPPVTPSGTAQAPEWADQAEVPEAPIFAAPNGRRRRRMRALALVAAGLLTLWVAALAAGMLGFGRLPTIPDVGTVAGGDAPKTPRTVARPAAAPSSAGGAAATAASSGGSPAATSPAPSTSDRRSGSTTLPSTPQTVIRRRSTPANGTTPAPAATPSPAASPAPTTTATPGRRVGQTRDTTTTSTTTAPSNPGPSPSGLEHRQSEEHAGSKKP